MEYGSRKLISLPLRYKIGMAVENESFTFKIQTGMAVEMNLFTLKVHGSIFQNLVLYLI